MLVQYLMSTYLFIASLLLEFVEASIKFWVEHMCKWYCNEKRVNLLARTLIPSMAGIFSLYHNVQTGSRAQQNAYPMGTGRSFPEGKAARAQIW